VDPLYRKIREASNPHTLKAQLFFEEILEACGQFLGSDPAARVREDFYPVWWELYLAYALRGTGITLASRTNRVHTETGPDLLAENPHVWIEAVMPDRGDGRDAMSEPPEGPPFDIPIDDFVLGLRSAISGKVSKLQKYIDDGTISAEDPAIIAVSGARLPFRHNEGPTPNIVRALLGVGSPVLEMNPRIREVIGRSVGHKARVSKKSGNLVNTDPFLQDECAHVSAVIYSSADCVNFPKRPGDDFVLVHNPKATVSIARRWLPIGKEYWIDEAAPTLHWRVG
jgi:hypothetical protein